VARPDAFIALARSSSSISILVRIVSVSAYVYRVVKS
jgi:hypothetical protein